MGINDTGIKMPFGHELYILAAVLDPRHVFQWLPRNDEDLELKIRGQVIKAAERGKAMACCVYNYY